MRCAEIARTIPAISETAAEFIDSWAMSPCMPLADALIGATATVTMHTLITANVKHFAAFDGLSTETFEP